MNSKEKLKKLANQLMFDLSDDELIEMEEEFNIFLQQIELLNGIDTEGVEPMVFPFETPTTYMRADKVMKILPVEYVLKNAHRVKSDHVLVPKVVR